MYVCEHVCVRVCACVQVYACSVIKYVCIVCMYVSAM